MSRAEAGSEQLFVLTAPPITTLGELEAAYQAACVGRTLEQIRPVLALRNLALDALLRSQPAQAGDTVPASAAPLPDAVQSVFDAVSKLVREAGRKYPDLCEDDLLAELYDLLSREAVPEGCVVVSVDQIRTLRGYVSMQEGKASADFILARIEEWLAAAKEKPHG